MVLVIILIVPRDDSSRIPRIDYVSVAEQAAESSKKPIIAPELEKDWWSNQAKWLGSPVDAVPRFEVGFVGPKNEYIGMIQAFGVNPTWLALTLKDVILEKNFSHPGSEVVWEIHRAREDNDQPRATDYYWVATIGENAILLYGTGSEGQFETLSKNVEAKLEVE